MIDNSIELLFRRKLSDYGNVMNKGLLTGILYNIQCDKKPLTENDINNLFKHVEVKYYFEDSQSVTDYNLSEYYDDKGIANFKILQLSTDLSKFMYPICISFNFYRSAQVYTGVFIGPLSRVYEYNMDKIFQKRYTSYNTEESIPNNDKIKSELSKLRFDNIVETHDIEQPVQYDTDNKTSDSTLTICETEYINNIYSNINNPSEWGGTKEQQYLKIAQYISYLTEAIENKLNHNSLSNNYIKKIETDFHTFYLVNTRLLNKFGDWIYVCYTELKHWDKETNKVQITLMDTHYIGNIIDLYNMDDQIPDINLNEIEPIQLYNNISDLVVQTDINHFDLELTSRNFTHIIEERRDRLPKELQDKSIMDIVFKIKNSIEYAVKASKIDYNYIVPSYSIERDSIQYLIPLLNNFEFTDQVESVLVVNKIRNKFIVNTVLKIEDAYALARVLNKPSASWFRL